MKLMMIAIPLMLVICKSAYRNIAFIVSLEIEN